MCRCPAWVEVNVGKGRNAFGADPLADKEVSLDLQVVAGVAPQAKIVIYFTEGNESGYADGVAKAVHDAVNNPSVIVFTWGEIPEDFWPNPARLAMDANLAVRIRIGVTVVAATGDELATERRDGVHVDYPASSPYVLACGGTQLTLNATGDAIVDEVVWNAGAHGTGGGISDLYPVPAFQKLTALPPSLRDGGARRGIPDVAAAASETNGYRIVVDGEETVTGGTSAAAPLWVGFIVALNAQRRQTVGYLNPLLYENRGWFRQITSGNNKLFGVGYVAGPNPGWNACAGLGVPIGLSILAALSAIA